MILWRISRHGQLDGTGGLIASARWHTAGHRIVYLADSPASALLETLVHLELVPDLIPAGYRLLKIDVPDALARDRVSREQLEARWEFRAAVTRSIGDQWLYRGETALLRVPSALVPETDNWLLNPEHAGTRDVQVLENREFPFDSRLFRFAR